MPESLPDFRRGLEVLSAYGVHYVLHTCHGDESDEEMHTALDL